MYNATLRSSFDYNFHNHVVYENVVGGSSMKGFPLVITVTEQNMPGI